VDKKNVIIGLAIAALVVMCLMWWRNRPVKRAGRLLENAAATASVTKEDSDISRRMKYGKLRNYTGYELHVDVKGIADACDLMQDEAISAWAYAVGRDNYLTVKILDVDLVSADEEKIVVNADISVDSDYQKGRYSKTYPVVLELKSIERRLRVISMKTRL